MSRRGLLKVSALAAGIVAAAAGTPARVVAATALPVDFPAAGHAGYEGRTRVAAQAGGFVVTRAEGAEGCTAWGVVSSRIALPPGVAAWALDFEIRADCDWYRVETSENWRNAVTFYRADGSVASDVELEIEFPARRLQPFRFTGAVPAGAVAAAVRFGIDSNPPVRAGERVEVRRVAFARYAAGERVPEWIAPDIHPPRVTSAFASPTADVGVTVRYRVEDPSGVDWSRVAVTNEATGAAVPFVREGDVLVLRPGAPWPQGVTRLAVAAADTLGQSVVAHKVFLVGEAPQPPRIRLRDDGVALLDGRPWFPVGFYGVEPCAFNGFDYARAFADLARTGVTLAHSYGHWRDAAFYDGAEAAGTRLFVNGKPAVKGDAWFLAARARAPVVAWYIGDDTSMNTAPQELLDRDEACRMLDGTRLTCHADGVGARRAKSNLRDYVDFADVFLPEIYPFDGHRDEQAVAEVCRDMDRCFSDYARFARTPRARAVWAILQCFDGMSWKRYPTAAEIYSTSFAALVHGAQGITWFKYGGAKDEAHRYSGAFRTPEDWTAMTNVIRRISALRPVLVARTPPQPPVPEVVRGPRADPLGQPSVTQLLKRLGDDTYVLAVNAAPEPVRARFRPGVRAKTAKVAWESREIALADGAFEDDFDALGVHVYRVGKGK